MSLPFCRRFVTIASLASLLAACTPTFNWREVPIADNGLVALLPCKADRATRVLPLGAESVTVDMVGCEAGGATFAVAHAAATSPAQAEAWMRAWQAAMRLQMADAGVDEAPATLARAASWPAPVRLDTRVQAKAVSGPEAAPAAHVLWFAQQTGGAVSLYQATVIGRPSSSDAPGSFFEGLHLP